VLADLVWLMWTCLPAVAGALKLDCDLSRWVVVANPLMLKCR